MTQVVREPRGPRAAARLAADGLRPGPGRVLVVARARVAGRDADHQPRGSSASRRRADARRVGDRAERPPHDRRLRGAVPRDRAEVHSCGRPRRARLAPRRADRNHRVARGAVRSAGAGVRRAPPRCARLGRLFRRRRGLPRRPRGRVAGPSPVVARALMRLRQTDGGLRIGALADELHLFAPAPRGAVRERGRDRAQDDGPRAALRGAVGSASPRRRPSGPISPRSSGSPTSRTSIARCGRWPAWRRRISSRGRSRAAGWWRRRAGPPHASERPRPTTLRQGAGASVTKRTLAS